MKNARIRRLLAGAILAVGMVSGLAGCDNETASDVSSQIVSTSSEDVIQESSTEEIANESEELEFNQDSAMQELDKWATDFMNTEVLEMMNLPENLRKSASLSYVIQRLDEESAVLRYYITASDMSIYVMDEKVNLVLADGTYHMEREELQSYTSIEDSRQFKQLHKKSVITPSSTGYNTEFFRRILRSMLEDETACKQYTDPVTAAVSLLHLGPGQGEITGDMIPPEEGESYWPHLNKSVPKEGTVVTVSYTFDKDGSVVEIPMQVIEESQGIWAPAGCECVREIYDARICFRKTDGEAIVLFDVQTTSYGLYKVDEQLRCIYPYYMSPSAPIAVTEELVYFVTDSLHQEGNLEYQMDTIAILDIETGEVDKESMKLSPEDFYRIPWYISYQSTGFMGIDIESVEDKYIPLVNTGKVTHHGGPVWEGKPVASLNEQEQNTYGNAIREELLAEPGKVLKLSNRTMTETYTYIDLDGDGVTEKIVLTPQDDQRYSDLPYDNYVLSIGDSSLEQYGENVHNDLYAFSMDGKEILILMLEDGPSSDDESYLYAYREGQIVKVGQMSSHIGTGDVKNGRIYGSERGDVIQSDYISVYWHIGESGLLEQIPQESYDYGCLNDIELLVALPVHSEPNLESTGFEIQPQTVKFLKTDSTFSWVYVQAENGDAGWVYVENYGDIVELNMDSRDVFEGLYFFG